MAKLRRTLLGMGLALGGMAAVNRLLRARAPETAPHLPGEGRWFLWRTGRVAYTEAGAGTDLLLLHGPNAAASSFEMRRPFAALQHRYRVIAPDLPGFGRSDRPALRYTGAMYADFVRDFSEAAAGPGAVLVASSLSSAYAIAAAAARPTQFAALALINPTVQTGMPGGRALGALLRMPVLGESLFFALVSRAGLNYFLRRKAFAHPDRVDPEFLDQNYAVSHRAGARFAPASFLSGDLSYPAAWEEFAGLTLPVLLIWGEQSAYVTQEQRAAWEAQNPRARSLFVPDAGEVPHEERTEVFLTDLELALEEMGATRQG